MNKTSMNCNIILIRVIAKKSGGDREALRTSGFVSSAVCVQLAKNITARLYDFCTQNLQKNRKIVMNSRHHKK